MKRYKRKFEENFDLDLFIESYQIKEAGNNIAVTSMESFYNMLNMYKGPSLEDIKNITIYKKSFLISTISVKPVSKTQSHLNYEKRNIFSGAAGKHELYSVEVIK